MACTEDEMEEFENELFEAQYKEVRKRFGVEAAKQANYGWGVSGDEKRVSVASKVYGHGVLTTEAEYCDPATICHSFRPC